MIRWWRLWRLRRLERRARRLTVALAASKETGWNPGGQDISGYSGETRAKLEAQLERKPDGMRGRLTEQLRRTEYRVRILRHLVFGEMPKAQLRAMDGGRRDEDLEVEIEVEAP